MCRVCQGDQPNPQSFLDFEKRVIAALKQVNSQFSFFEQAREMDSLRFDTGSEWGEPRIFSSVKNLIFANPDPNEGLLLFTLGCWLDMQAQFTIVWTTYLRQAKNWINNNGPVPRGSFAPTTTHLLLTRKSLNEYGSITEWFARKINTIAEDHGPAEGNIYRLAGEVCNDLYSKPEVVYSLRDGVLPSYFSGGDHKRFWMFMMFLKRDNSFVRCLFSRALANVEGGKSAIRYWYDNKYFNSRECELPVDFRVRTNWNRLFEKLNMNDITSEKTAQVAKNARTLAQKENVSPSVFDAILFYSGV